MFLQSPRWLIKRGRDADAARALGRLTGLPATDPVVELEIADIKTNMRAEAEMSGSTYADCFKASKNRMGLRTWTGVLLQGWQQLTGINFIFYYGTTFFRVSSFTFRSISPFPDVFTELWYWQPLHRVHRHQRCQRRHDPPRYLLDREGRTSQAPLVRCRRHVYLRVPRRHRWCYHLHR